MVIEQPDWLRVRALLTQEGVPNSVLREIEGLWNRRTPPAGWKPIERVPPAYKFLMERCWYWVPVIDDESLPPDGWKGVVEAETKRGHIEYRQAEYKKPLFGGKPEWSAWTFREEGDWKPLRWLKKWDIQLLSAAPENDDEQS